MVLKQTDRYEEGTRPWDIIVGSSSSIATSGYNQALQYGHCLDNDVKFDLQQPGYAVTQDQESKCWNFYCDGLSGSNGIGMYSQKSIQSEASDACASMHRQTAFMSS